MNSNSTVFAIILSLVVILVVMDTTDAVCCPPPNARHFFGFVTSGGIPYSVSSQLYIVIICITIIKIDVLEGNLARPVAAKEVVMPFAVTAPEGNAGEMSRKPRQPVEFQTQFSETI